MLLLDVANENTWLNLPYVKMTSSIHRWHVCRWFRRPPQNVDSRIYETPISGVALIYLSYGSFPRVHILGAAVFITCSHVKAVTVFVSRAGLHPVARMSFLWSTLHLASLMVCCYIESANSVLTLTKVSWIILVRFYARFWKLTLLFHAWFHLSSIES